MQFKYPELFYAFFLLLIPILIHLFQLRKFKTEIFTNVAFLKHLKLKTRKSSQLKKWLVLSARLLFLSALIFAFTQPFYSKFKQINLSKETVIYLDNSFSLKAKGKKGELFQEALQDLISKFPENETISVLTNTSIYRNTTLKSIKKELLKTEFTASQIPYESAVLKAASLFSKNENSIKNLIFVSDFQDNYPLFDASKKPFTLDLVKLQPENSNNTYIDSIYIAENSINTKELVVKIGSNTNKENLLPLSLYNNGVLVTKSSATTKKGSETRFTIPNTETFNGTIRFNDNNLAFDNAYYFSIKKQDFITVLEIKSENANNFLKRIYTNDEFRFTSVLENQLDYSLIEKQNTIVLNELKNIAPSLITALTDFSKKGGSIIIIPNKDSDLTTYNSLLNALNFGRLNTLNATKKSITQINYAHPLYAKNVFEKQVKNFQYPTVNSFFTSDLKNVASVLSLENNTPFLASKNNTYLFTSALANSNSNFTLQNLVVPTFYNIALQSLPFQQLNYTIGETHQISIQNKSINDQVIHLKKDALDFIPLQKKQQNNVILTTTELPKTSGHYNVNYDNKTLQTLSYNYTNKESILSYHNLNAYSNVSTNLSEVINSIQSDFKINALWKWFVIFALLFLGIEMLLLKFLK